MSTCNWLDLQTIGSQPVMPKNLPDHCGELPANEPFEVQDGIFTDYFRGMYGTYLKLIKKNQKITQHITGWTWAHSVFGLLSLKNLPKHC